ncbi:MAG: nucleoside triphosphate pyrophosphohydrolase [Candidatus Eisenbacteria bacterium]|nr:nucleoside triphosphate pyrophosphohydrolase [Candidatus Eisenbacteria bacterium]
MKGPPACCKVRWFLRNRRSSGTERSSCRSVLRSNTGGEAVVNEHSAGGSFQRLVDLTRTLRSSDGCAWDRAQTIETLRPHLIEEFHEVLEALDASEDAGLRDELGDLLFLVVFMAQIASEDDRFDIAGIIEGLTAKLVRRHPHVFGDAVASTPDEVRSSWEKTKLEESTHRSRRSILDGLPRDLSSLLTARRIQEKAGAVGFDWKDISDVLDKVREELGELEEELDGGDEERLRDEVGDLLFSIVNLARFVRVDPDQALRQTNLKFRRRFACIEERFADEKLSEVGLDEMDRIWNEAKDADGEDR